MKRALVRVAAIIAMALYGGLALGLLLNETSIPAGSLSAVAAPAVTEPDPPVSSAVTLLGARTSCAEIAGTEYRSEEERGWYLENCVSVEAPTPSAAVIAPNPPPVPGAEVRGERWILVDTENEQMTAMIGDQPLYTALVTTGKEGWETPHGTFAVLYRVANETMTSASIGAEEEYVLTDVLYTQYFTTAGHAIHLNYWRPDDYFGRVASSHGCVGARLADAEFFWRFATYGTRVTVV